MKIMFIAILALIPCINAILYQRSYINVRTAVSRIFSSYSEADYPSDSLGNSESSVSSSGAQRNLLDLKSQLIIAAQESDRGQKVTESSRVSALISEIESLNSEMNRGNENLLKGKWELIWTNDDITRSSPFFWAFKKAFKSFKVKDPLNLLRSEEFPDGIFRITDSIPKPIKEIGLCSQTFTASELTSQIEIKVLSVGSSKMTTTSTWSYDPSNSNYLEVRVDTTKILESTLGTFFPFLDQALSFPSGAALELAK
jgi:hypothetical protein